MFVQKPVVLVTTKNEEANEIFVREAERLVNRKGKLQIIQNKTPRRTIYVSVLVQI